MNAYSGLPSWLTEMPDLDLNKAIQDNIIIDQKMRQENMIEDVSDYYQENPGTSWEDSRDDIEQIVAGSGDINTLIQLDEADRQREQKERQEKDTRRKQILEIAKLDPDAAKMLWESEGLPGDPNFERLSTKTTYAHGRQITEHPDGSVTIKQLYDTKSPKENEPIIMYNENNEMREFNKVSDGQKAGYPYRSPQRKNEDAFDKKFNDMVEKLNGPKQEEKKVIVRRKK